MGWVGGLGECVGPGRGWVWDTAIGPDPRSHPQAVQPRFGTCGLLGFVPVISRCTLGKLPGRLHTSLPDPTQFRIGLCDWGPTITPVLLPGP